QLPSTTKASKATETKPIPPPRGVALAWLRRSPGWSSMPRRWAWRIAMAVPAADSAPATTARPASNAGSDHRIVQQGFHAAPLLAAGALPMVAARAEAAAVAAIAGIAHQQLVGDVLEIVQGRLGVRLLGQGQVDQRGLAAHRGAVLELLGQVAAGGADALLGFHHPRQRQHRRDPAVVFAHLAEEGPRAAALADLRVAFQQHRQDHRQVVRVMARGTLERADGGLRVARLGFQPALGDAGPYRGGIGGIGARQRRARRVDVAVGALAVGQFALELRDQLAHRLAGGRLVAAGVLDRLLPVALGLVNADQVAQRLRRPLVEPGEVAEHGLGAVQQAGAHVVLAQRGQRLDLLRVAEVGALRQRLVQADRAVDLAATAEQVVQRDLGLEGVLVQFGDVQEQLDRLVRLLVEQVVQAAEISGRQLADLA